MNINRNNYEEYFLLYADKELSAAERSLVDSFVQQNPDLEEELIMLQQSIVKPDNNITLHNKSILYKEEFININNYDEAFVLYNDNELNASEREEIEKFIQQTPSLQKDFELLQKIKYQPDTSVVFPDKKLLFKKEDNRIIPMWWKAMAAAVLLGIGLWVGINYQKDKAGTAMVKIPAELENKNVVTAKVKPVEAPKADVADNNANQPSLHHLTKKENIDHHKIDGSSNKKDLVKSADKKSTPDITKNMGSPHQDVTINEPQKKVDAVNKTVSEIPVQAETVANTATFQTNYAQSAAYINEEEVKSENYVFYNITQEEFKKSKIGNFLKRIKRTIERKNPLREKTFKVSSIQTTPAN